ncbi:cellulase family glycosylhydrolase [Zunongwangia sp. HGR-M22]|uniref:cellulase family glycosylhydrolase n=1 Tax=Zunongwangia sp. HGR-M22 TaxID=3015168 RepID=UPI0022DE3C9E|nr:cellulase family glycosylhydrolase [Zunongwangia sp. HGR-M22]WBL24920.1 cellulase family glycosylhydrolase [Zunongwangia sp. HGR-M22]
MKLLKLTFIFLAVLAIPFLVSCSDDDEVVASKSLDFSVYPSEIDFASNGGNNVLNVNSSQAWTIEGGGEWLSWSEGSAEGSKKVNLSASQNQDTIARSSMITITSGDQSFNVNISQQAMVPEPSDEIVFAVEPDSTDMSEMSAVEFASQIDIGWNLGNSLEAIGGETAWGNPMVTKRLLDSVKAAGFEAVRIPVAWSKFSDEANYVIQDSWMARVEEVVNYALDNDMYVIMNIHWDGGWMQPTYADQDEVNERLDIMWTQIGNHFMDYGPKLLFAGTNEVMVEGDYNTPTEEYYTVQNSFNQTFVDAVRSTGGKNAYRYLVVQGFNTNIDHTINFAEIPDDVVEERLMMEVHYYDPYNFALNADSNITQWGSNATDPSKVETWANESRVDQQFQRMKTTFIDQGVAVILGEYGAIARTNISGHKAYREDYFRYITQAAQVNGLVPIYWDNGDMGQNGFAMFDRNTGATLYPDLMDALVETNP